MKPAPRSANVPPQTSALAKALLQWQRGAGPYWPYVCAAPFLAASWTATRVNRRRTGLPRQMLSQIVRSAQAAHPAILIDLSPTRTLPSAPALNRLGFLVAPVIQRWVAAPAVLPCEPLLEELVAGAAQIRAIGKPLGVVFVLDGDRNGQPGGSETRSPGSRARHSRFDNRYRYPICRFPPPDFLRSHGVSAVCWISRTGIADDLLPYAQQLAQAGLEPRVFPAGPEPELPAPAPKSSD